MKSFIALALFSVALVSALPNPQATITSPQPASTSAAQIDCGGEVDIGNTDSVDTAVNTGHGGVFGGKGGAINNVQIASTNGANPTQGFLGSVQAGNIAGSKVALDSGDGSGFGSAGQIAGVNVASTNWAAGGAWGANTNVVVANAKNSSFNIDTSKGGVLGGQSGEVTNVDASTQNSVNLNKVTGGQVGVISNGNVNVKAGSGTGFTDSNGVDQVKISSQNSIN